MDKKYGTNKKQYIKLLYIIGIILWISLIIGLGLFQKDPLALLIISIPFIIFIFDYFNVDNIDTSIEVIVHKFEYLSIALIMIVPLITWFNKNDNNSVITRKKFMKIMITALILVLLSLIDLWVSPKYISMTKHCKAILQTLGLTLIIYSLYTYYIES